MLRLLLDGNEMDLYEDVSVNLTLQFSDVQNVNSPAGSFSQTFRIPATANNLDYFGAIDDTTAVDIVNVKQRIPAQILSDTIPILSGFCQVKAVYLQKEKYADIELVFFGGAVDLKSSIGDGMISDLDLSALNHTLNRSNVESSWTISTGLAPYVRYGLVDKGFNWSATNPPWTTLQGIYQNQLTPFVSVYSILDAIITEAGYTWESSFFVDPAVSAVHTKNMYVPCVNGSYYTSPDSFGNHRCACINQTAITETGGGTQSGTLAFVDNILNAWDVGGNFDATTHEYTAPVTGRYSFRVKRVVFQGHPTYSGRVTLTIQVDRGSGFADYATIYNALYGPTTGPATWDYNFFGSVEFDGYGNGSPGGVFGGDGIDLVSGDKVRVTYYVTGAGKIQGDPTLGIGEATCLFFVTDTSPSFSEYDVDVAASLPELKQMDFVMGLQKMFNLVFVPDKNKPNHLIIEPFQDYVATGTQKDWTDKVDYSKDLTFKPTTDLQKKEYLWTYKAGTDFISDAVQKSLERTYGEYKVTEPNNDFSKGDMKIESTFGQYMMSLVPDMDIPMHRSLNAEGNPIEKPLTMIAYWTGLTDRFGEWYMEDDLSSPGTVTYTDMPIFSNFSSNYPTISDKDLNYGMEQPFVPIEVNPANTLYFEYWAQYVAELYSNEARIMTCTMRLSKRELADFEFSDNIYLKDSYWRVLKINYDTNVEGTAKVELIKILSDVEICADIPTGWNDRYQYILFNNSTSVSPDFGSEACCTKYGYEWTIIPVGYPGGTSPMGVCVPKPTTLPPTT